MIVKDNIVKINFNKNFYNIGVIKEASEAFKEFGDFSLNDKENISVSIKLKDKENADIIGYEFCNYILALMKNGAFV
jgi:hypothetical protein